MADRIHTILDEQSFKALFEQYWHSVYAVCLKYTGAEEDSRELAQEIFFSLWKRKDQLQITTTISGYLHGAAKLKSFEFIRNRKNVVASIPEIEDNDTVMQLDHKELHFRLQQFIEHLPEPRKKIFRLSREEGLSHKQISADTGVSERMVEYHIGNALRTLRSQLKKTFFFL